MAARRRGWVQATIRPDANSSYSKKLRDLRGLSRAIIAGTLQLCRDIDTKSEILPGQDHDLGALVNFQKACAIVGNGQRSSLSQKLAILMAAMLFGEGIDFPILESEQAVV